MKKTLRAITALCLAAALLVTGAFASGEVPGVGEAVSGITSPQEAADYLYSLGLFRGTGSNPDGSPVYELERTPTRFESVTMLVRLLGAEDKALAGSWRTPFRDLYPWAEPYVGYAYANGLTNGTSADTYDGSDPINASQYLTFVLRALGYESGVDFQWQTSWQLTDALDITDGQYKTYGSFSRGDAALVSARALSVNVKGEDYTLYEAIFGEAPEDEEEEDEPSGSEEPIATYTGRGDDVITGVNVPKGDYYVEYTCTGSSDNFSADLYYGSSILDYNMIGNDIGPSSGRRFIDHARRSAIRNGMIEVEYDGSWTIQIKPVAASATTNVRGSGDAVTGIFTAKTSRAVVSYSAVGSDNIAVNLYAVDGTDTFGKLVANGIAPCSGASVAILTPGEQYFMVVDAGDNTWSIDFGLGDSVTNYDFGPGTVESEEPEDPGYDDPGDDPGDEPGSEKKWSYDDVTRLQTYFENANTYLTRASSKYSEAAGVREETYKTLCYNQGISALGEAVDWLEYALSLMDTRIEITYVSGGSLNEEVRDTVGDLEAIINTEVTKDNLDDAVDDLGKGVAYAMRDISSHLNTVAALYEQIRDQLEEQL